MEIDDANLFIMKFKKPGIVKKNTLGSSITERSVKLDTAIDD